MQFDPRRGDYTIGALARAAGCGVETIRYYERRGLLSRPARTASGRRMFDDRHLWQLRLIRAARGLGLPLERIRGVLAAVEHAEGGCEAVYRVLQEHHLELREGLRRLQDQERLVGSLVRLCRPGQACDGGCRALAMLEGLAAQG